MKTLLPLSFIACLTFFSSALHADCGWSYKICTDNCSHYEGEYRAGCMTKCTTERASCEAEKGWEKTEELREDLGRRWNEFLRGYRH